MSAYENPEIDEKVMGLTEEVHKLIKDEKYEDAIIKNDEVIANLDAFAIAAKGGVAKRLYHSTVRDKRLLKLILELKIKDVELESTIDKLDDRVRKLEKELEKT